MIFLFSFSNQQVRLYKKLNVICILLNTIDMTSNIINSSENNMIEVFDMINKRMEKLENFQEKIDKYLIYQERRKINIYGGFFDWEFNVEYSGNKEKYPRSDAIILDLDNVFINVKDFTENIRKGLYDEIMIAHNINSEEIKKIKDLPSNELPLNYNFMGKNVDEIILKELFNNFLKPYDMSIKSISLYGGSCFIISKKELYIDEFINPMKLATEQINGSFDLEHITAYYTKKQLLVAYLMCLGAKDEAKKIWETMHKSYKNSITTELKKNSYFSNSKFDFVNFKAINYARKIVSNRHPISIDYDLIL